MPNSKYIVSAVGVVLAVLSIIFGAALPLLKSQAYIDATNDMSNITSVQAFKDNFDAPLKFSSPIGDQEIIKYLGGSILNILTSQKNLPEDVARSLASYIEPYFFAYDTRHAIIAASMYQFMWEKYGHDSDYQKAIYYYNLALKNGPKLPPVLYSLLTLYAEKRDKANEVSIANAILAYWPQDMRVTALLLRK